MLPTLHDRSLHWLINGYHAINKPNIFRQAFFQCKAGTSFNLSFDSLTSHEALQVLRDVEKNDVKTWDQIKMAQYNAAKPQSESTLDEVEPPFAHAADVDLDPCDIPVDAVLLHITSGGSVPHGYGTDNSGNLLPCNQAESYDQELKASTTKGDEEVFGRGKCRHVENTQYKIFWKH
ncbi:uncharacterized protein F5891DRAFT_1188852 [Suillus fuscotomentosus]|uniref:Uncharacterized protein n=1 Tax=Suillus fuscotomentosus TaxID=1912939 RepID=A0AAD4E5L4_9AGAM|nr:uncharacterized protein F5891DRAFT_1188852 [Suillus fuscotomentosus]KAG1900160.1 hypothetical protein F5891DRAFT_1188852 [Suillus fuscotomentosus]